jgi:hypothetical protein
MKDQNRRRLENPKNQSSNWIYLKLKGFRTKNEDSFQKLKKQVTMR